jgi:hypothetical protein
MSDELGPAVDPVKLRQAVIGCLEQHDEQRRLALRLLIEARGVEIRQADAGRVVLVARGSGVSVVFGVVDVAFLAPTEDGPAAVSGISTPAGFTIVDPGPGPDAA